MSDGDEKTFHIEGMTCGSCELTVREEVEELDFVDSAQADRSTGELVVRGEQIDEQAVRDAVTAAGYKVAA
jgi:copper chaperone CopZ